jgi:hypothetical protein
MKNKMILVAMVLLMITISSNSYADDFFYDYGGRKIELRKIPNIYLLRTNVLVDDIETDLIKDKIYGHIMGIGAYTIVTSDVSQDELESIEGVYYVSPGYVSDQFKYDGDIDTIFQSGLISVRLRHPDDVLVLKCVAEHYHMNLLKMGTVTADGFSLEFRLSCPNSSTCNEIQIANILYERGKFEQVYPLYIFKTILGGGGGGDFGVAIPTGCSDETLAVSKTSPGIPKIADITVRQTNRLLRITGLNQVITSNFKVEFYSIAGKRQKVSPVYHSDGTISVAIPDLVTGLYFLRVGDGKNRLEKRVLVR